MKWIAFPALVLLTACSMRPDFSQLQPGMNEQQVVNLAGKPQSVAVKGNTKIYEYESWQGLDHHDQQFWYVRFVNGKVESFGHKGDFDSTNPPPPLVVIEKDGSSHN